MNLNLFMFGYTCVKVIYSHKLRCLDRLDQNYFWMCNYQNRFQLYLKLYISIIL